MHTKKIVCFGAPFIGSLLKSTLEGHYEIRNGDYPGDIHLSPKVVLHYTLQMLRADYVCLMFVNAFALKLAKLAKLLGKKVIFYWLGTDIYLAMQGKFDPKSTIPYADLNISYAENLQKELADMGLQTQVLPLVPDNVSLDAGHMPAEHAVLLSIPDNRKEFYGYNETIEVIKRLPDVKFYVVRAENPAFYDYPNVVFKGMVRPSEMDAIYDEVSIILRYPEHDGLSLVLMEATIKGKQMVYRFHHPFAVHVSSTDEICAAIKKMLATPPAVNEEASAYGRAHYNVPYCRDMALQLFKQL